jgi:hypothetical protein
VVNNPTLWWPNGYGEPFLYDLRVNAQHATGAASISHRLGFRRVELVEDDTAAGGTTGKTFYFKVNDVPVFAKGANWIPSDSFPTRVNQTMMTHLLSSAQAAHMNMVRGVEDPDRAWPTHLDLIPTRRCRFGSGAEGGTSRISSTPSAIGWDFSSGKSSCLPAACASTPACAS